MIAGPPSPADDETLRRLAGEILARQEFSSVRRALEGWESLLERVRWLRQIFDWSELADTNPLLFYAILFGLLAVSAALILHIVWTVRSALMQPAPATVRAAAAPARRFDHEAESLAREGRFLEAAHRLQLGVLELLLRGRRLELSRSEPNRVLRRRIAEARLSEVDRGDLVRLLDRFETRWFRDREEDPGLYEDWRGLYQRLTRGLAAA